MTDVPLLAADRVRKLYPDGKVLALDGVSVAVAPGEFVAVTGPSGCGKSTLLNLLGALDRLLAREIGFVFQSFLLLPTLTARENVQVPMFEGPPLPARDRAKKADALLDRVGMAGRAGHRPGQLSVGERQRVALARALANDPALLLADEPTGNLDSDAAESVLDLFATLRRDRGVALVVVTHSPDVAARADRVVRLRDGRVV